MTSKTIAGKKFEKVADNYCLTISKKHSVLIVPTSEGWEARENKITGKGKYMDGTKTIKTISRAEGSTLEEAAAKLFAIMEPTAQVKAAIKYNENNVKQVKLNLNLKTDADIIAKLEAIDNKQGYIKELIRKDLNR